MSNYKVPFYAMSKAIYAALNASAIGLQWFDASVPIDEIEASFANQSEFAYGIFANQSADCDTTNDAATWTATLDLEIYSNYKGRKVVAQKLEALLNYLSTQAAWNAIQNVLTAQGFVLLSINVGTLSIGLPMVSDAGMWQNGTTDISLVISQTLSNN